MPELTDDQLDGLFRKSAEEFDPPFDPAAWQDMKTRLDANDRSPAGGSLIWKNLLRWGLPIALLLLLSGGGWYAYRRAHPINGNSRSRSIPEAGALLNQEREQTQADLMTPAADHKPVRTTPVGPEDLETHTAKQPTDLVVSVAEPARSGKRMTKSVNGPEINITPALEAATKHPVLTYRPKTERSRLNRSSPATRAFVEKETSESTRYGLRSTNLRSGKRTRTRRSLSDGQYRSAFTEGNQTSARASVKKRRGASGQPLVLSNTVHETGAISSLSTDKTGPVSLPTLTYLTARPLIGLKLPFLSTRPVTVHPDTTVSRVVSPQVLQRGLSIRIAVAPDLSTVGLTNFSRPGTTVGLLLEYRLARRWSVQAGVLQSTKVYRTLPEEYAVPVGEWGGYVKPLSVDGRCNMLDIPLTLRYDIWVQPQQDERLSSRWFISGGVTSYIMESEDYVYNYPPHTYRQTPGRSVSTGSYGLSHVNLSVGYERTLNRRLAWQIEPFVKMPLRGVGYFSTDLFSTGAFLSIRYKF